MSKVSDVDMLLRMEVGDVVNLNWHEEGGGEVVKGDKTWALYEVSPYGGEGNLIDKYEENELDRLLMAAYNLT